MKNGTYRIILKSHKKCWKLVSFSRLTGKNSECTAENLHASSNFSSNVVVTAIFSRITVVAHKRRVFSVGETCDRLGWSNTQIVYHNLVTTCFHIKAR